LDELGESTHVTGQTPDTNSVLPYETPQPPVAWDGRPPMHRLASSALTLGVASFLLSYLAGLGAILGVVALAHGALALRDIGSNPEAFRGREPAVVGIIFGSLAILIGAVFAAIFIGDLIR